MFKYKINYWDADEKKTTTSYGFIGFSKYDKVCKHIIKYYGKENINSLELVPYDDLLEMSDLDIELGRWKKDN